LPERHLLGKQKTLTRSNICPKYNLSDDICPDAICPDDVDVSADKCHFRLVFRANCGRTNATPSKMLFGLMLLQANYVIPGKCRSVQMNGHISVRAKTPGQVSHRTVLCDTCPEVSIRTNPSPECYSLGKLFLG
jgi:hypothetical protein